MRAAAVALLATALLSFCAGTAAAEPEGYYYGWGHYAYRYEPVQAYGPSGGVVGVYPNQPIIPERSTLARPYLSDDGFAAENAAAPASALVPDSSDDVTGLVAPDGHPLQCAWRRLWDPRARIWLARRVCW